MLNAQLLLTCPFVTLSDDSNFCQILYDRSHQPWSPAGEVCHTTVVSQCPTSSEEGLESDSCSCRSTATSQQSIPGPLHDIENRVSPAVAMAKEFVADIFRRAKEAKGTAPPEEAVGSRLECLLDSDEALGQGTLASWELGKSSSSCLHCSGACSSAFPGADSNSDMEESPKGSFVASTELESPLVEPGYVNYTKLRYVLEPSDLSEAEDGEFSI